MVIKVDQVEENMLDQGDCIKGESMKIHRREDAKPYCVSAAGWIPFLHLTEEKPNPNVKKGRVL